MHRSAFLPAVGRHGGAAATIAALAESSGQPRPNTTGLRSVDQSPACRRRYRSWPTSGPEVIRPLLNLRTIRSSIGFIELRLRFRRANGYSHRFYKPSYRFGWRRR